MKKKEEIMEYADLEKEVKAHVADLFNSNATKHFYYHNLSHTEYVQARAMEIASQYPIGEQSTFILSAAAWFMTPDISTDIPMITKKKAYV